MSILRKKKCLYYIKKKSISTVFVTVHRRLTETYALLSVKLKLSTEKNVLLSYTHMLIVLVTSTPRASPRD